MRPGPRSPRSDTTTKATPKYKMTPPKALDVEDFDIEAYMDEDDDDLFGRASVCVLGVAGASILFAGVFGGVGMALGGLQSFSQIAGQTIGGSLGAAAGVTMHKEDQHLSLKRSGTIFVAALLGSILSWLVVPSDMELGILASAVLTGVGAVSAALLTDPVLSEAFLELAGPVLEALPAGVGERLQYHGAGSPAEVVGKTTTPS